MPLRRHSSDHRDYRLRCHAGQQETVFQVVIEQTDLRITAQRDLSAPAAASVRRLRGQIKAHAELNPTFLAALTPLPTPAEAPPVVQEMYRAAAACGVGPMAAVAGAIAEQVGRELARLSSDVLVENGGDLYLISTRPRTVGLLAVPGQDILVGVPLRPDEFPCSFCASSATIGHSLSFGRGDLAVVRSRNAALADACATALANRLHGSHNLDEVVRAAAALAPFGIDGVFLQVDERVALWGSMELVEIQADRSG